MVGVKGVSLYTGYEGPTRLLASDGKPPTVYQTAALTTEPVTSTPTTPSTPSAPTVYQTAALTTEPLTFFFRQG